MDACPATLRLRSHPQGSPDDEAIRELIDALRQSENIEVVGLSNVQSGARQTGVRTRRRARDPPLPARLPLPV